LFLNHKEISNMTLLKTISDIGKSGWKSCRWYLLASSIMFATTAITLSIGRGRIKTSLPGISYQEGGICFRLITIFVMAFPPFSFINWQLQLNVRGIGFSCSTCDFSVKQVFFFCIVIGSTARIKERVSFHVDVVAWILGFARREGLIPVDHGRLDSVDG